MDYTFILLALIVLFSYTIHALSGFGSLLIAITLGLHLYPADELLPIIVPVDVLLNLYLVIKYRHLIERRLLVRRILPFMGIGLIIGILLFNYLHNNIIKIMYACFILLVSVRELYLLYKKEQDCRKLSRVEEAAWLMLGGLIKGVFGSGGPPLVYVAGKAHSPEIDLSQHPCDRMGRAEYCAYRVVYSYREAHSFHCFTISDSASGGDPLHRTRRAFS